MSVYKLYNINCDYCQYCKRSVKSFMDEVASPEELRALARTLDWDQILMPNGGTWDFCPGCAAEYRAELAAEKLKQQTDPDTFILC